MIYFVFFFVLMPVLEITIFIKAGSYIGTMNTVLVIICTGFIGATLIRIQGFLIFEKIKENLSQGVMPRKDILDGALVLAGGVCLLAPGLIGDAVGIFLLVPWSRSLIRSLLIFVIRRKLTKSDVITVEVVRSYSENSKVLP